jgi:hypothetical protein
VFRNALNFAVSTTHDFARHLFLVISSHENIWLSRHVAFVKMPGISKNFFESYKLGRTFNIDVCAMDVRV